MSSQKPKVLIWINHFLPGINYGGPVNSVLGVIENLKSTHEIFIVTKNRDHGAKKPYENIKEDLWLKRDGYSIIYCSQKKFIFTLNPRFLRSFDYIYFNSFFSIQFTAAPLLANILFNKKSKRLIIAPRGELSKSALHIKKKRKAIYKYFFSRLCTNSDRIMFQASSEDEKERILQETKIQRKRVLIARDLFPKIARSIAVRVEDLQRDKLKIIFVARICQMKNLTYALDVLSRCKRTIDYDLYGPIEDEIYWKECQKKISSLPRNIKVQYQGILQRDLIDRTIQTYDLFFMPTLGESFGHSIIESMLNGTPVLISDRTPWKDLQHLELGYDLQLNDARAFVDAIEQAQLVKEEVQRTRVIENANKLLNQDVAIRDTLSLFS